MAQAISPPYQFKSDSLFTNHGINSPQLSASAALVPRTKCHKLAISCGASVIILVLAKTSKEKDSF